jgi:hypothetical protein
MMESALSAAGPPAGKYILLVVIAPTNLIHASIVHWTTSAFDYREARRPATDSNWVSHATRIELRQSTNPKYFPVEKQLSLGFIVEP